MQLPWWLSFEFLLGAIKLIVGSYQHTFLNLNQMDCVFHPGLGEIREQFLPASEAMHWTQEAISYSWNETLTFTAAVVPQAATLLGHLELGAQALALAVTRLEKEDRQLPDTAPFAARQLWWPEAHLLQHVDLLTWTQPFLKMVKVLTPQREQRSRIYSTDLAQIKPHTCYVYKIGHPCLRYY